MSNDKLTPIEWLISQLQRSKDWYRVLNEIHFMTSAEFDIVQIALQMENEEMQTQYQDGKESVIIEHIAALSTQQANDKEVFRQQIIQTYIDAQMERNLVKKHFAYFLKLERVTEKAKQYYNQTYNEQR